MFVPIDSIPSLRDLFLSSDFGAVLNDQQGWTGDELRKFVAKCLLLISPNGFKSLLHYFIHENPDSLNLEKNKVFLFMAWALNPVDSLSMLDSNDFKLLLVNIFNSFSSINLEISF